MTAPALSIELMRLINGYQVSQALHVAAMLGVADQLKDGSKSYEIVAQACGAHPTSLYRLLRALAAVGVFREGDNKEFSLTPLGLCLTSERCTALDEELRAMDRYTRPMGVLGKFAPKHQVGRKCSRIYVWHRCLDVP